MSSQESSDSGWVFLASGFCFGFTVGAFLIAFSAADNINRLEQKVEQLERNQQQKSTVELAKEAIDLINRNPNPAQ